MPNEPVDEFILSLPYMVEHCRFGGLKEEIIRDHLFVNLADVALSERLKMDPNLTLQRAVESARDSDLVKRQQGIIRLVGYYALEFLFYLLYLNQIDRIYAIFEKKRKR